MQVRDIFSDIRAYDFTAKSYNDVGLEYVMFRVIGSKRWITLYSFFDEFDEKAFKTEYLRKSLDDAIRIYNPNNIDLDSFNTPVNKKARTRFADRLALFIGDKGYMGNELFLHEYMNVVQFITLKAKNVKKLFLDPILKKPEYKSKFELDADGLLLVPESNFVYFNNKNRKVYVNLDRFLGKYNCCTKDEFMTRAREIFALKAVEKRGTMEKRELPFAVAAVVLCDILRDRFRTDMVWEEVKYLFKMYHSVFRVNPDLLHDISFNPFELQLPCYYSLKKKEYQKKFKDLCTANWFFVADLLRHTQDFSSVDHMHECMGQTITPIVKSLRGEHYEYGPYEKSLPFVPDTELPASVYKKIDGQSLTNCLKLPA